MRKLIIGVYFVLSFVVQSCENLRCYLCDSRRTGSAHCTFLNASSSSINQSVSSKNPSASCAIIVGLAEEDPITGHRDLTFTIRTLLTHCRNQPLGNVTYDGIQFSGRLVCCSTSLCNKDPLSVNSTLPSIKSQRVYRISKWVVFSLVTCLGLIFIVIGISLSIYRCRSKKSSDQYISSVRSDGARVIFLSER